jgi:hypothetical protein
LEVVHTVLVSYLFAMDKYKNDPPGPIRSAIWGRILSYEDLSATMTLAEGDLLSSRYNQIGMSHNDLVATLCDGGDDDHGFTATPSQLSRWIRGHEIYLQVVQAIPQDHAFQLHSDLHEGIDEPTCGYLGCVSIDQENPIQYQFFIKKTDLYASYQDGCLKVFQNGQARDVSALRELKALPFDEIEFEALGPQENGNIFDRE